MVMLILGLLLFLGIHSLPMFSYVRGQIIQNMGMNRYRGLYSVIAGLGFLLIIMGYGRYRAHDYVLLWSLPSSLKHLTLFLMWPALVLLVAAYCPGHIKARIKHPMLYGIMIWAVAHLLVRGDAGSLLLFGGFLVWAILDRHSANRRLAGMPNSRAHALNGMNDLLALGVGTGLYLFLLLVGHRWLIGIAPLS